MVYVLLEAVMPHEFLLKVAFFAAQPGKEYVDLADLARARQYQKSPIWCWRG